MHASTLLITIIFKGDLITYDINYRNISLVLEKIQILTPVKSVEEIRFPLFTKADVAYVISDPYTLLQITPKLHDHVLTDFITLIILSPTPPFYTESSINVMKRILNQYYNRIHETSRRLWRHSEVLTV